jgi:hypothetical protein
MSGLKARPQVAVHGPKQERATERARATLVRKTYPYKPRVGHVQEHLGRDVRGGTEEHRPFAAQSGQECLRHSE